MVRSLGLLDRGLGRLEVHPPLVGLGDPGILLDPARGKSLLFFFPVGLSLEPLAELHDPLGEGTSHVGQAVPEEKEGHEKDDQDLQVTRHPCKESDHVSDLSLASPAPPWTGVKVSLFSSHHFFQAS